MCTRIKTKMLHYLAFLLSPSLVPIFILTLAFFSGDGINFQSILVLVALGLGFGFIPALCTAIISEHMQSKYSYGQWLIRTVMTGIIISSLLGGFFSNFSLEGFLIFAIYGCICSIFSCLVTRIFNKNKR